VQLDRRMAQRMKGSSPDVYEKLFSGISRVRNVSMCWAPIPDTSFSALVVMDPVCCSVLQCVAVYCSELQYFVMNPVYLEHTDADTHRHADTTHKQREKETHTHTYTHVHTHVHTRTPTRTHTAKTTDRQTQRPTLTHTGTHQHNNTTARRRAKKNVKI